ncbi:hypothetical protein [Psychrobacillus sp. FJAT-21963]|uniref:hypothetical protein n=1 Tax=Psychrobacillus sp. FJAT-21963 TaxID=1712028 RepID=UPI0006F1D17D|nr:hypothetical protein [Psychrobacillus sp. FJAT-21963]KQL34386.1 hypothetical protein AN959_15420 [Psychrobacillus sp. FJAT-21963]
MKDFYVSLFALLGLCLLAGCTDNQFDNKVKPFVKTEEIKESDPLYVDTIEDYKVPFKISQIKSVIVKLNDSASEIPLKGVRYEVSLMSEKEISIDDRTSYNFEIVTDSSLKESLGPIQPLHLTDTRDGYLYTLSFETIYRDYSIEELEKLNKERNFKIYLNYKGVNEIGFL